MGAVKTINQGNRLRVYEATVNPASVAAATVAWEAFTVTGLAADDVLVGFEPPADLTIGIGAARVSAANEVKVQFINPTAGPIDGASGTWKFYVAAAS